MILPYCWHGYNTDQNNSCYIEPIVSGNSKNMFQEESV